MEIIYYDHALKTGKSSTFRTGSAIRINIDEWSIDNLKVAPQFELSINTYCAVIGFKIFNIIWKDLPLTTGGMRLFDTYEETTILPHGLIEAEKLLRRFVSSITGKEVGTDIKWSWSADKEYRIIIDMMEVKHCLSELADFLGESAKMPNNSVEFWL